MQHSLNSKSAYPFESLAPTCGMTISQYTIYTRSRRAVQRRQPIQSNKGHGCEGEIIIMMELDIFGAFFRFFIYTYLYHLCGYTYTYAGLISQSKKNKTCKHFDTDKNELHIENVKKKCPIVQNKYRKMALWWCRIL